MNKLIISPCLLVVLMCCFIADLSAARDLELEKEIAGKLFKKISYGEVVWLGQEKNRFIGLFYEVYPHYRKDAVIILHGMGAHPDWPDVIAPLRDTLPRQQLATLSIQLPLLTSNTNIADYGRTFKQAGDRIDQAVEYLQNLGFRKVILVGYNFGACTAAHYLVQDSQHNIDAFVSISILARKFLRPRVELDKLLQGIQVPFLDIYAEMDHAEILSGIDDRRLAANISGNRFFKQLEIKNALHDYAGYEDQLASKISDWIIKLKSEQVF